MNERYELLARLGTGGFGTVYRARVRGAYGFQRDVALKLLDEERANAEVLARFRDEARLLGRIRHPNVPSVGPPVHLDVGWAVAMDLVPGVDCGRILKKAGPMPVRVALETTCTVARTLHDLHNWTDLGEEHALQLLHRDLKPSNIMITRRGRVQLLDFGAAWAAFDARESVTLDHIGGSQGYIPPERLEGTEGPPGDIYALGVVLHAFLMGEKPPPLTEPQQDLPNDLDADTTQALLFAQQMRALDPNARPTPAAVVSFCDSLLHQCQGPSLVEWAAETIPDYAPRSADERVGQTLAEKSRTTSVQPTLIALGAAFGLLLLIIGVLLGTQIH